MRRFARLLPMLALFITPAVHAADVIPLQIQKTARCAGVPISLPEEELYFAGVFCRSDLLVQSLFKGTYEEKESLENWKERSLQDAAKDFDALMTGEKHVCINTKPHGFYLKKVTWCSKHSRSHFPDIRVYCYKGKISGAKRDDGLEWRPEDPITRIIHFCMTDPLSQYEVQEEDLETGRIPLMNGRE